MKPSDSGSRMSRQPMPFGELMTGTRYLDRKSTRLNSSHLVISYAVFCLKKKKNRDILHASPVTADEQRSSLGSHVRTALRLPAGRARAVPASDPATGGWRACQYTPHRTQ